MWTTMKKDVAKQHITLRDQLREQFQDEKISDVDFLYESTKLFKPITESTEKMLENTSCNTDSLRSTTNSANTCDSTTSCIIIIIKERLCFD